MIIAEKTTDIQGNLKFDQEIKMQISTKGAAGAMIIRTLTNLYSAPYVAALREYASNAYDSHIRAGQTKPIEISLPNRLSPNLVIEDFGVGLSQEQLIEFGQYGDSSKGDSNDEIGGFGLGSKSGLAISSQFTVRAIKDGKRNMAVIGYDENGAPTMKLFPEQDTDEPNGVKITIPTNETYKFREAIDRNLFLGWAPGTVLVDGQKPGISVHDTDQFSPVGTQGWVSAKNTGEYDSRSYWGDSSYGRAVIGPIEYKVRWDSAYDRLSYELRNGYFKDVVLNLPIGSVDLVPSREELRYTARTQAALKAAADDMIKHAHALYQKQINDSASIRDALQIERRVSRYGFEGKYTYNGVSLSPQAHTPVNPSDDLVTAANIKHWASRTGTQAYRKRYDTLSLIKPVGVVGTALSVSEVFLVAEAGDLVSIGGSAQKKQHDIAKLTQNFLLAEVDRDGSVLSDAVHGLVLFTSLKLTELDPIVVGSVTSVVPVSTFTAQAEEYRREKTRATRAANKTLPKPKPVDSEVRHLSVRDQGRSTVWNKKLSDLDTKLNYIILRNQAPGSRELEFVARRTLTTQTGWEDNRSLATILSRLDTEGYQFIMVHKNEKDDNIRAVLPNIKTIPEALDEVLAKLTSGMNAMVIQAARDADNRHYYWAQSLKPEHIVNVKNQETRDWLTAVNDKVAARNLTFLQKIMGEASNIGLDVSKHKLTATATTSPGQKYPLLKDIYSLGHRDEAVSYINMMDHMLDNNLSF